MFVHLEQGSWVAILVFILGALGWLARLTWNHMRRPRLVWSVESVRLLEQSSLRAANVTVAINGEEIRDAASLTVKVRNAGKKAIKSSDFDQAKPCVIHLGSRIRSRLGGDAEDSGLEVKGADVVVLPQLIPGDKELRVNLLAEGGRKGSTTFDSSLSDISVLGDDKRSGDVSVWQATFIVVGIVLAAVLIAGVLTAVVHPPTGVDLHCTTVGHGSHQDVLRCTKNSGDGF